MVNSLNKNELEHYEKILREKYNALLEELRYREQSTLMENQKDVGTELSSYANHPAEAASDYANLTMNLSLVERESKYLQQLEDAIYRIENGTYGICNICQKPIPKIRLDAVPTATKCIECKNEAKKHEQVAQP